MSVTSVQVVNTLSATVEVNGSRQYDVLYIVETSNKDDNAIAAIRAPGIPTQGNFYVVGNDFDTGAFARNWSTALADQDGDRKTWHVTVHFASSTAAGGDSQHDPSLNLAQQDYPWLEPSRVSMTGIDREEQTKWMYPNYNSAQRTEVLNSAGDPTPDPFVVPQATPHLTIERDYRKLPSGLIDYINKVNATTFFGQPHGWWRLTYPRVTRMFTGSGLMYFNVVYDFEYASNNVKVIDRGYFYVGATGQRKRVKDVYGSPSPEPMNLDGNGSQYAFDGVEFPVGGVYRHREVDFTGLQIPKDWTDKSY